MYIKVKENIFGISVNNTEKIGSSINRISKNLVDIGLKLESNSGDYLDVIKIIEQINIEMDKHLKILKNMEKFLLLANERYKELHYERQNMLEQVLEPTSGKTENLNIVSNILKWFGIIDAVEFIGKNKDNIYTMIEKNFYALKYTNNTIQNLEHMDTYKEKIQEIINDILDNRNNWDEWKPNFINGQDEFIKTLKSGAGLDKMDIKDMGKILTLVDVALSTFFNINENFFVETDEYGNKLSNARAAAETVLETAIDMGKGVLIGAGVAFVGGTIGAPALLVGFGTIIAQKFVDEGLNMLVNLAQKDVPKDERKDFTEWVSDGILDFTKWLDSKVNAPKKPSEPPVINWA